MNTICPLWDWILNWIPCPQGVNFEVRWLQNNGGTTICTNNSCPHQQTKTREWVSTVLVGFADWVHYTLTQKR